GPLRDPVRRERLQHRSLRQSPLSGGPGAQPQRTGGLSGTVAELFDYVREVNRLCDGLLLTHTDLLVRKNIRRKRELIQVIKVDLDKLAHALLEVKENHPQAVLEDFFGSAPVDRRGISGRLVEPRIYHVGFEIH